MTTFYATNQPKRGGGEGAASSGWATLPNALDDGVSGLRATLPVRTERRSCSIGTDSPGFDTSAETVGEVVHRLDSVAEGKASNNQALLHEGLVQSWPKVLGLARESARRVGRASWLSERED